MYNPTGQPSQYPPYPYPPNPDQTSQQAWQSPTTTFIPNPNDHSPVNQTGWYIPSNQPQPIAGPSTYQQGQQQQPIQGYPPIPGPNDNAYRPSTSQPNLSSAYNTPHLGNDALESVTRNSQDRPTGVKKKRKKGSGEDGKSPTEMDGSKGIEKDKSKDRDKDKDKDKRTKTGRACDACRTKKIRCDILQNNETPVGVESQPICAHCKQAGLECTFFLPITETRFKKRKAEQSEPPSAAENGVPISIPADGPRLPPSKEVSTRVEGPTSLSFLLQTSIPASASEAYDLREHNRWEVTEDGNGLIRVSAPPTASYNHADADPDDPTRAHNRLNRPVLSGQTISLLVNAYFDHIAPLFPIISRADFAAKVSPSPLLLYAICGLGSTRREFPREVFAGVRGVINGLLRSNDILSDARFENVQALLLLSQVGDLHAQPTAATASASLIRMGIATRMAQDLGLHREPALRPQTAQDLAYIELRRRVWTTCVILDRWYGAALGIPLLVDLLDCDVLLPAPYEIIPGTESSTWPVEPSYLALGEHLKLSVLIGRVLKTIYSPTGLKYATDDQLETLLRDMTSWREGLPEELRYKGVNSSFAAGLLHMSHAALQFLFWRVFMRITYTCPAHLQFRLNPHHWNAMYEWSRESIEWLAANDQALDTIFIYAYTATNCALVQYHTWARRRDRGALDTLRLIKEVAVKWEREVQPDQMSIRRKTCETMTLLYEAALKTNPDFDDVKDRPTAINPTPGVLPRQEVGKAIWVKDEGKPSGGYWLAGNEQEAKASGISEDFIVIGEIPPKVSEEGLGGVVDAGVGVRGVVDGLNGNGNENGIGNGGGSMFQDVQSGRNVNPQMNFGEFGAGVLIPEQSQNGFDFLPAIPAQQGNPGGNDFSLLDGLPMSGFDFPSWEVYFQTLNSNGPQDPFTGM